MSEKVKKNSLLTNIITNCSPMWDLITIIHCSGE